MLSIKNILHTDFIKKINNYNYDQHIIPQNDFQYDIIGIRTLERSYLLPCWSGINRQRCLHSRAIHNDWEKFESSCKFVVGGTMCVGQFFCKLQVFGNLWAIVLYCQTFKLLLWSIYV